MKGIAVLRCSFDHDHLGGRGPIIGLDDGGAAGRPSIRVVGETGRGRRLVEREDVGVECATGQFAGQLYPPLQLARLRRPVPIDSQFRVTDYEDVCVICPFIDRVVQTVEMCPPEGFVFAAVIAARRGHQGNRRLLGCAVTGR